MRCFRISNKKLSKIKKIIKINIIIIIILSSYSLSGCTNKSDQDKDEYEFISLSVNDVNQSLNQAKKWLISNMKETGFSNYLYDYKDDLFLNEDNLIHQLKVTRLLAELSYQNDSIKEIHKINMDHILNNLYAEKNKTGYIIYDNKTDIIYNALFLRTLLISPLINDYAEYTYKLANTIISLQNQNGSFKTENISIVNNNESNLSFYYNEEVILSLIEMYSFTKNISYLNHAILTQDYFIETYLLKINEKYYSALIPGHSKSMKKLYDITKDEKYASIILFLNNKLLDFQETENLTKIGHFSNLDNNYTYYSNSSLDGYIIEGISDVLRLFENTSIDDNQIYKIRLILGIYNLNNLQYSNINEKINGAIKYSHNNHLVRIDSTQNAIEAYQKILFILNDESNWNYSYYPELNLLLSNNQNINLEDASVWYALVMGTIFSIILVFIVYISIKIKSRKK